MSTNSARQFLLPGVFAKPVNRSRFNPVERPDKGDLLAGDLGGQCTAGTQDIFRRDIFHGCRLRQFLPLQPGRIPQYVSNRLERSGQNPGSNR